MAIRTFFRSLAGVADGVENATEWALDQVFAGDSVDAFDFTRELIHALNFHVQYGSVEKKIAPNRYTLQLRPDLYKEYAPLARQYEHELGERLRQEIAAKGCRMCGKIEVRVIEGEVGQRDEMIVACVVSADTVIADTTLQLFDGIKRYTLPQETTSIGRHPDNDIFISHEKISRYHAEIRSMSGRYVLVDLGSTNHTSLNEQCLHREEPVFISAGDRIRFAEVEFLVERQNVVD